MSNGIMMGNVSGIYNYSVSITPASVSTITSPEQTFTVPGIVLATDAVIGIEPPSNVNGVSLTYARVTADNTIAIKFVNPTAGSVTPAAGLYNFTVVRANPANATSLAD